MTTKNFWRTITLVFGAIIFSASTTHAQTATPDTPPGRIIAQSGDAYIAHDQATQTWEIGTGAIRRRMQFSAGSYRLLSLKNKLTNREWLAPGGGASAELRIVIEGQILTSAARDFILREFSTQQNRDGSVELIVALARQSLVARLRYIAFPNTSVIEQWVELENAGRTVLRDLVALDSISLSLRPTADALTLHWVQGLSPAVEDRSQVQPFPALRMRAMALAEGVEQVIGSNARSSEDTMGWFVLIAPNAREGLFGGIEWSGAWQLRARREAGQTTLRAGLDEFHLDLAPGGKFQSPRRFIGFFRGGIDDAAFASHTFARRYLMRQPSADFPWTQYNTWFAYYTDFDEDRLQREVDHAAAIGLDVFVVDAGWYEGSLRGADFSFGLGTWRENREKFPHGLRAFSDYVHSQGMKFGLWVEPERVDLAYVDTEIPFAWLAPNTNWIGELPEGRARTTMICLGHRSAREWIKTWLARLIRDYRVDWIKWDNNMWMSCDPPGEPGIENYAHVQGLYEIFDYLRAEFPNVIIENCASGGNRMDYALLRRSDVAWLSDETDPSYRVRYHAVGASFPFPPEYLNSALVESWFEPLSEANRDFAIWRGWLRSRMLGAFAISAPTLNWSHEFRDEAAREIARYKSIRDIIAHGRMYHLFPQSDLSLPMLQPPNEPDAIEFYDSTTRRGIVFLFRGYVPWSERRVVLRALAPNVVYDVQTSDGAIKLRRSGRQLITDQIEFTFEQERPSAMLFITPAPSGATPEPLPKP